MQIYYSQLFIQAIISINSNNVLLTADKNMEIEIRI